MVKDDIYFDRSGLNAFPFDKDNKIKFIFIQKIKIH